MVTTISAEALTGASRERHAHKAEELLGLAQDYMRQHDRATHRWGWWARRSERRAYEAAMYVVAVAQVDATLAAVES